MIAALDIGGTKISSALLNGAKILERFEVHTPEIATPEEVSRAAIELLQPFKSRVSRLGVAATGRVTNGRVTALNSETMQGWHDFDLQTTLEQATSLKTIVLNDADAAAWGEAAFGAGRDARDFVFVTISTGIGGGLILNSRLHTTPFGLEADLGFTLVNGTPLEFLASGTVLDRYAVVRGWTDARDVIANALIDDGANIKLEESAGLIAAKLADLRVTLGITRAVIGGGLGLAPGYLERLKNNLEQLPELYQLEIVPAALGVDAGLIGAADWVQISKIESQS
jgi:predicted NBD/HSP70 family sugar kinase